VTRRRIGENRVLRRIFGATIKEVMGDLRKLYNEELLTLVFTIYYYNGQVKEDEMSVALKCVHRKVSPKYLSTDHEL
jgi:hypothetical protein